MTTITAQNIGVRKAGFTFSSLPVIRFGRVNTSSIVSLICLVLFVLYFIVPHRGLLAPLFHLNVLFVVGAPLAAFIFAIISVRQISRSHDRGLMLSTTALVISSLYIITGLALPFVLVSVYVLYAYILR